MGRPVLPLLSLRPLLFYGCLFEAALRRKEALMPWHHICFSSVAADTLTLAGQVLRLEGNCLDCPSDIQVRDLAAALHAQGFGAADIAWMSEGLATPCRLIRFDTHGTTFVIEVTLPELVALLRLLQLESAVHKQGYEVERL